MITAVPAPTMVTIEPLTVATAVLPEEYVKAPAELDVGAVTAKASSPKVLAVLDIQVIVGVAFATVSVNVAEPAL